VTHHAPEGFAHEPVLADEVMRYLAPRPGGVYCDATLGGAGHAARILEATSPDGRLFGIDRDPSALAAARTRLQRFGDRVTLVHGRFGDVRRLFADHALEAVDGFLLDVGVSSPQLDRAERGFSFQREGPLDMRMDPSEGETARELCARISTDELARILREWGEERYAGRIARAIKGEVEAGRLLTTGELAALVARSVPTRERSKDPATRTFQALRIAVNDELGELERFLGSFVDLLRPGGRVVIIAFHGLEDGLVKRRFRELSAHSGLPADVAAAQGVPHRGALELLTKKPVWAGDEETARNPRARSARLRAAVRSASRAGGEARRLLRGGAEEVARR
jgi:16S rRNA (cytosine1402-N4)-methyltransferase